jgi:16S rRNA (guanine527-N7)-methyltransferase
MSQDLWNQLAAKSGRTLDERQLTQMSEYIELLLDANMRMNLTRIIDRDHASVAHVGDALTLLPFIPADATSLADVGSGGGVPGLPLAIALPNVQVTLIESTQKKAAFLREAAQKLGLTNVTVIPLRAEEAAAGRLRESFSIVTARAVGELVLLVEWCLPLVKKAGHLLAMKGQKAQEELTAAITVIHLLNGGEPVTHKVELPGTEHHVIIDIPKLGASDRRYPRPASIAKGKPLR